MKHAAPVITVALRGCDPVETGLDDGGPPAQEIRVDARPEAEPDAAPEAGARPPELDAAPDLDAAPSLDGGPPPACHFATLAPADRDRDALFAPDCDAALVTLNESGRAVVLDTAGDGAVEVERVAGVGVAEQMAMVRRGALRGQVLLPATGVNDGPKAVMLRFAGPGAVEPAGEVLVGPGYTNIPRAVAVGQ